jgi:hypothetical protein
MTLHCAPLRRFKYVLQLDGNGAPASRALPFMFLGSLTLKQESPYQEFFYPSLSPYVHYLPMDANATDVLSRIRWAKANDAAAKRIADTSKQWACAHLHDAEITCYVVRLLTQYASLLSFPAASFLQDPAFANLTRVHPHNDWTLTLIRAPAFVPDKCEVYS